MEIFFERDDTCYAYQYRQSKLYRVSVKNISRTSIEEIVLSLERVEPKIDNLPLPFPLHPMHGKHAVSVAVPMSASGANEVQGGVTYGGLHPDEPRFFDVIQMRITPGTHMEVYPSDAPVPFYLPRGRYTLTLRAYGRNAIPAERQFVADVSATGDLLFGPLTVL